MFKKLMASTMILLIISGSSMGVYANNAQVSQETKIEEKTFNVNTPKITSEKDLFLTLTGPEGTKVTIDVYYNTSVSKTKQNYVLAIDPIEVEIGALQRNWVEIELSKGLNKIDFTAVYKDGVEEIISRIIEVKDKEELKEELQNTKISSPTNALKSIVNTGNN
ncbi:MAG: hypothetical protein GX214_01770 [Clostridiales bacterium]|nr:hypothetical protein [Clostridiales bacterium]